MPGSEVSDVDEEALLLSSTSLNKAYDTRCNTRLWEVGIPAFATLACILCLYVCEDCLFGVMLFCLLLCFKDWVLVLVFFVALGLLVARHPLQSETLHRLANAGYEIIKTD
jgi:hypothetical protein